MAAGVGRSVGLTWDGTAITGVREKGFTMNGEPIDITSGEDTGDRTLATVSAQDDVDVSVSGVSKDSELRDDWFAGARTKTVVLTFLDGATLSGTAFLSNYSEGNPYNDAVTFEATLMFTGAKTYTAS